MKNGKAPGVDKITTEMVKNMGRVGKEELRKLLNTVWQEGRVPEEWEVAMIVPIYKTGDKGQCKNYRGIALLGTIAKVYEKILVKRIRSEIETKLLEAQSGFRPGRSTHDHIFALRTIINRTLEAEKEIYIGFIDMEKAFDRVPRKRMWEGMLKIGISRGLLRVCQNVYSRTRNVVATMNRVSKEFVTRQGVRQGESLSPLEKVSRLTRAVHQ